MSDIYSLSMVIVEVCPLVEGVTFQSLIVLVPLACDWEGAVS